MTLNAKMLLPALLGLTALTLTGCSCNKPGAECADPVLATPAATESLDTPMLAIGEGRTTEGMLPVYYNFDSSKVRGDQEARIQVNADFMNSNSYNVAIEGNTDSRGTQEYNMALGERRALAAKKALMDLGVEEARLSTVSYGEERLLLTGQNEEAWAQNRRSDFVVVQ